MPDGNVLWPGQSEYRANLRRLHNDGSGLIDDWSVPQTNANLNSSFSQTALDDAGRLHVLVRRADRVARGSISFFGEFGLANGKLLGQQALYSYRGDRTNEGSFSSVLSIPVANRALAGTYAVHAPDPTSNGAALLDTTVLAHGDVAVATAVDAAHVAPGVVLGIHASASYSGDQPITGATLALNLPWQSGVTELACHVQNASNCILDSRAGNVRATFDAMPGASVEITGKVLVLDIAAVPIVYAFGYGPIGLSEQDTDNNFARATPTQSLFFDGFDGSH
jgi:hypothetical protein